MKNTFVDKEQWDNMLKDLPLPEDELLVAESIRRTLTNSPNPKAAVESIVSVEDDIVSIDRLELMNVINLCLADTVEILIEEQEADPDNPEMNEAAIDMINAIDSYEMVKYIWACMDGGAFAEFLGRLYDMFCK